MHDKKAPTEPTEPTEPTSGGRLQLAPGLDPGNARHLLALDVEGPLFVTQKAYRNGVVVHTRSVWGGNGFGTDVVKVAVRDGYIVGFYESGRTHVATGVVGNPDLSPDFEWSAGRRYTTKTRLSKWTTAIKELPPSAP